MLNNKNIFAAVKTKEDLDIAIKTDVKIIFHMLPDIITLKDDIEKVHKSAKKIYIHIDLAEGIGKDKMGLLYVKNLGVDGIISTRQNIIKMAKEQGLSAIQRFFLVDSHSVDTAIESLKSSKADMAEIMPGVITKAIKIMVKNTKLPIIAGGLIDKKEEVDTALSTGASAISTGNRKLWIYK